MLILPPGHNREVAAHRRFSGPERRLLGVIASVSALLLAGVLLAIVLSQNGGRAPSGPCLNLTIASSLGGQQIHSCGAHARAVCATIDRPGGYQGQPGTDIAASCRRLGIKVG